MTGRGVLRGALKVEENGTRLNEAMFDKTFLPVSHSKSPGCWWMLMKMPSSSLSVNVRLYSCTLGSCFWLLPAGVPDDRFSLYIRQALTRREYGEMSSWIRAG